MFERQSMEEIVNSMIEWARGATTKLTDFRVGSKIRTLYEAVALVIEERTDRLFRSMREIIESNTYAIFGFDKIPAMYATGVATFSRTSPAEQAFFIPAGTAIMSQASQYNAPVKFYTTQDAVMSVGNVSVDIPVACAVAGAIGNIEANTLTTFIQAPLGINSVTNAKAFTTGQDEETSEAQKARFQAFMQAQSRGVLPAIEYGAKLAKLTDAQGAVTEQIKQAKAVEDLQNSLGTVKLYIWNGVGTASQALIDAVNKNLTGYYDSNNNPVYGYKPAGILVSVYQATINYVNIKLIITPESWTTVDLLKPSIEAEISRYFVGLQMGQPVIQTALEANIKYIDGVYDVKVQLSTDNGASYNTVNVTVGSTAVAVVKTPIVYV